MSSPRPAGARVAGLIYLAMLATVVLTLAMAAVLRTLGVFDTVALPRAVTWAPLLLAGGASAGIALLRGRLPQRPASQAHDAWWAAHLPRAVVLWTLAESSAVLAAVVYLVTGAPIALGGAAVGLALLALNTPSALADR
jgi:hypothetical protein